MINKRGLTPLEFDALPEGLFEYLMVFDQLIEPSGIMTDMHFHTQSLYNTTINNSNLTTEMRKSIKPIDFDFMDILKNPEFTAHEKHEKREAEKLEKQSNSVSELGKMIKQMAGGSNGRQ